MVDAEKKQAKPAPRIRRFTVSKPVVADAGEPLTFAWSTRLADQVRLLRDDKELMTPTAAGEGSHLVTDGTPGAYLLEAKNESGTARIAIIVRPAGKVDEQSPIAAPSEGAAGVKSRRAPRNTSSVNPFKVVKNGFCPVCETKAPRHTPPVDDQRYKQQIEMLRGEHKEKHGLELNEDELHLLWLKRMGGYIARCPKDDTDFFVKV